MPRRNSDPIFRNEETRNGKDALRESKVSKQQHSSFFDQQQRTDQLLH